MAKTLSPNMHFQLRLVKRFDGTRIVTHANLGQPNEGTDLRGEYGATAAIVTLAAGESKTVTLALTWYLPYRTHGEELVGNFYTNLYSSAADVAERALARIPETWAAIEQLQQLCFDNTLPAWLHDTMINRLPTMIKTGMWFKDGRWRQWESFSCAMVEPIHIHYYRSLPYGFFFPSLQQNLLEGFANTQTGEGYITEHIGNTSEAANGCGRTMGDSCTCFLLEVWQNYLWTGDRAFFDSIWPATKRATQYQMTRCDSFGLPEHFDNTYDWWSFAERDVVSYNAVLHLAAMLAAHKMAELQGDAELAAAVNANLDTARTKLDELLWTGEYYRSWWMKDAAYPDGLHADTFYGQLWAFILDLGLTIEPGKITAHLDAEMKYNETPYGLQVMTNTNEDIWTRDDFVWQAGSIDWAALNICLGRPVEPSLAEAERVLNVWREHINDQWDIRDLSTITDGHPWCNSHYARQLMLWSIPLALSGQQYSAPDGRLSFEPRAGAPATLPFFVPTANGTLELLGDGSARLTVLSGELKLKELSVGATKLTEAISLKAGEGIDIPA